MFKIPYLCIVFIRAIKEYMIGCNGHEGALYTLGPMSSMNLTDYKTTGESIKLFVHAIGDVKA